MSDLENTQARMTLFADLSKNLRASASDFIVRLTAYKNLSEAHIQGLLAQKQRLVERLGNKVKELRAEIKKAKEEREQLQATLAETKAALQKAEEETQDLRSHVGGEAAIAVPEPSAATRPDTSDSVAGHRLEHELDITTYPYNQHIFDIISLDLARRICDDHRRSGNQTPLGCWQSSSTSSHPNGYVKPNLRNTLIGGQKYNIQIWLHQLALIGAGRHLELKATLYEDAKKPAAYQVSHLCHNGRCFNPEHLIVELGTENKERSSCQGHYIVKHGAMTWHPCAHHMGTARRRCLLPEKVLGDGWHQNMPQG
ncbi:MAG: hypothetical protein Q9224_005409 [Gallowayella concinna]